MLRRALIAAVAGLVGIAAVAYGQLAALDPFQVIPGEAQGGRGDLVLMHGGTIEGVHVIQGGTRECLDPTAVLPCRERKRSLNLDIGAGDSTHRGDIGVNFDVGRCLVIFDGHRHRLASFCENGITFYVKPRRR